MSRQKTLALDAISVGSRDRRDLGDVKALAASIAAVGLLHPLLVTPKRELVSGRRRLEACRLLGWSEVPVCVVRVMTEARDLMLAEREDGVCQLEMTNSEQTRLGIAVELLERSPKRPLGARAASATPRLGRSNDTREIVGTAIGMSSGTSYERAKVVVQRADAGDPVAVEALAEMDESGMVTPAYEKVTGTKTTTPGRVKARKAPRDRLTDALVPLHRHLKSWQPEQLHGTTPAQARRLLKMVQEIDAALFEVERALEARTVVSRALR